MKIEMPYIIIGIIVVVLIIIIINIINDNKYVKDKLKTKEGELRDINDVFNDYRYKSNHSISGNSIKEKTSNLIHELENKNYKILEQEKTIKELKKITEPRLSLLKVAGSNLSAIPYMSKIVADYETIGIEHLASALDWGYSSERAKKVKTIREIRADAKEIVEKNKYAQYQLAYLLELFPGLQDVIDSDYNELPSVNLSNLSDRDPVRNYVAKEEYDSLSTAEKNQLALDRYVESHSKTKWQIGRDYELYVGHQYLKNGWTVEFYGSNMGLEDLGRDLIVKKTDGNVLIVQCKYWSKDKLIHEKHITQLYGTTVSYSIENNLAKERVKGILITNIQLSEMAKKMASYLNVGYKENIELGEFPRIKCNNGRDEYGLPTKIYHLPFDQQYDNVKMMHKDDFWASTVAEAEMAGYRRANKWFGQ